MIYDIVCFENICLIYGLYIMYSGYGPHSTEATIPFIIYIITFSQNDMSFKNVQSIGLCKNAAKWNNQLENKTHNSLKQTHKNEYQHQQNNTDGNTSAIIFGTSYLYHNFLFVSIRHVFMFLACSHSFVVLFLK